MKTYPVTVLCRVMEVSASAFMYGVNNRKTAKKQKQRLEDKVTQIFIENKQSYGSRRLSDQLKKQGIEVGRYKTRQVMRNLKPKVRFPKRYQSTTDSHHNKAISPNRLDRQFNVAKPNQVWATDITYIWTLQGWLYLAVVIDLFARRVVGWAIDDHMRTSLCVRALQMAYYPRGTSGSESPIKVCCIIPTGAASMPARNIGSIWR